MSAPSMILDFSTTPDREAGEVVFAGRVHPRHFRRLPPINVQPACSQPAAMLSPLCGGIHRKLAAGEVSRGKKKRLGTLHQDVVTLIATRSMPMVSWRFRRNAS